ncbi:MAG: hypothetical protein NVS9B7_12130 [Flavisolibacter sp.]
MKAKRTILLMGIFMTITSLLFAQLIGRQQVAQFNSDQNANKTYGLTWLPSDYNSSSTSYPLIIFLHGIGEGGSGISGLNNLIATGLPYIIAKGWDPQAINPVDGKNYQFIVVSPQASSWSYGYPQIQYIIKDIITKYRVDISRIYLTGLSAGGAGAWSGATNGPDFAKVFSAIVPISAAGTNSPSEASQIPLVGGTYGLKIWSICGTTDGFWSLADKFTQQINSANPAPIVPALLTGFVGQGHSSSVWNTAYDASWRNNIVKLNIYEWMLQYHRGKEAIVPTPIHVPLEVSAGSDTTLVLPTSAVLLSGNVKKSTGTLSYKWAVASGPSGYSFENAGNASTLFSNLEEGAYILSLKVVNDLGDSGSASVHIKVLPIQKNSLVFPTANNGASYVPYSGKYAYGVNPGYYSPAWTAQNTATIAIGSKEAGVKGAGVKSLRIPIYDDYLNTWGLNAELKDIQYYFSLGASEITAFVGSPAANHRFDTTFAGSPEPSKVFKNLYEPVWLDNARTIINPNNFYAKYLFDVVKTYGPYVKFWEIVNEPDFTFSDAGWTGDATPAGANSWFYHNPNASEMINLRAPIQYYIRELRVAWEVIKKLSPNSYVCTGGIGYTSFLDALLRNSDNPIDGSVTKDFPLKGGAYFDVLSFHSYPQYSLKKWNNAAGKTDYFRHSDYAVSTFIGVKNHMESLMVSYGYNGNQYPQKQFICTETAISRVMSGEDWGGNEGQKNYLMKTQVSAQKSSIKQVYWFQLGDMNTDNQFDRMGLYYYFGNNKPYTQSLSDQGIALKTTSDLLYGKSFDSVQSNTLKLPSNIDGAAFRASDGSFSYVLWAKTTSDLSENVSAVISFPKNIATKLMRREWNYSETGNSKAISGVDVLLNGTPSFFEITSGDPSIPLEAYARKDTVIYLPSHQANLYGSCNRASNKGVLFKWTKISGPSSFTISQASQPNTSVLNLTEGIYHFELRVTDTLGGMGKDTMTIRVNAAQPIASSGPVAYAGKDTTITLPSNSALLIGKGTDVNGQKLYYQWSKISGPESYLIVSSDQAQSPLNHLTEGTYKFLFTVTNDLGQKGRDTMRVFVKKAVITPPADNNPGPIANAGHDTTITLPINTIVLTGHGSDASGIITSYLWRILSGPASYSLDGPTRPQVTLRYLVKGVYKFEFSVKDNKGLSAKDTITVRVMADQQAVSASLYPNPSGSILNLTIEALTPEGRTTILLYNMSGVKVYSEEFWRHQQKMFRQINVAPLAHGSYIMRIIPDFNTAISLKFSKE